jgi:hypothetical protein
MLILMILLFTVYENSRGSEPMMVMLASSAKRIVLDVSKMDCGRSLIYNKKSKGRSMEPCGTLSLTGCHLEKYSLVFVIYNTRQHDFAVK